MTQVFRRWRVRPIEVAGAAAAIAAPQLTTAIPASAYTYDGAYPVGSGCDNSSVFTARTALVKNLQQSTVGKVELRYSLRSAPVGCRCMQR